MVIMWALITFIEFKEFSQLSLSLHEFQNILLPDQLIRFLSILQSKHSSYKNCSREIVWINVAGWNS